MAAIRGPTLFTFSLRTSALTNEKVELNHEVVDTTLNAIGRQSIAPSWSTDRHDVTVKRGEWLLGIS